MKSLYAEFTALEGAADLVEQLLRTLAEAVRREPGNLVFDAYRKSDDPQEFFVFEIYADESAFRSHLEQEHGRVFNERLAELVQGGRSRLTWLTPVAQVGTADGAGRPDTGAPQA
ncbi:putative quinol monooxygenase [Lacisediminihabitans profunda]|uniref:Antibiotic biosynthesis monooxygenase n=1 Tax=Lacisediminihabitans profunda TaxID=2594790 RepID=A0A5C8UWP6_9MICO|nr:putative quinol monooxygenase [Lacisediminihabitans profunda]TXN32812.1 antibiotic biosynthesis monooxygenase [Lacisediminihabitans profunda]